ncbi:MAG: prolyl oligopeptidase family serine peptidase [Candidatus Obscuribacterales bacterium]|nr:prolyl oligopeptidase family serine peptidase [Candidatus Obscuribacterales bacterium]
MPFTLLTAADSREFYAFYPDNLRELIAPPIVVFLHGSGERGSDPGLPIHGLERVFEQSQIPAIVIFPQCDWAYRAYYGAMEERVFESVQRVAAEYNCDSTRVYLVGYSMGGSSAFWLIARYPDRFAGTVCIAPGITWVGSELPPHLPPESKALFDEMFVAADRPAAIAKQIGTMPIWFLQGTMDEACPIDETRAVVNSMQQLGNGPVVTEYEGMGHDTLTRSLLEDDLFTWLLSRDGRKG